MVTGDRLEKYKRQQARKDDENIQATSIPIQRDHRFICANLHIVRSTLHNHEMVALSSMDPVGQCRYLRPLWRG